MQLCSNGRRLVPVHDNTLKGSPGGRLELGLDKLHQTAGDMSIMLLVPKPAQAALGIFQLIQHLEEVAIASRYRSALSRTPLGW